MRRIIQPDGRKMAFFSAEEKILIVRVLQWPVCVYYMVSVDVHSLLLCREGGEKDRKKLFTDGNTKSNVLCR